jgi:signal transduction histidine kinase
MVLLTIVDVSAAVLVQKERIHNNFMQRMNQHMYLRVLRPLDSITENLSHHRHLVAIAIGYIQEVDDRTTDMLKLKAETMERLVPIEDHVQAQIQEAWTFKLLLEDLSDLIAIKSDSFAFQEGSFNPRYVIGKTIEMCRQQIKETQVAVNLSLNRADTIVFHDQRRFTQVFAAIFLNALKLSDGGRIVVEAKFTKFDDDEMFSFTSEQVLSQMDSKLIVQITDPDLVITNEWRLSLFRPIDVDNISNDTNQSPQTPYRRDSLYIARLIAHQFGGDITIE